MNTHTKKMTAPVIVVICVSLYYFFFGVFIYQQSPSFLIKMIALVIPSLIAIVMIVVLIQRIIEIRKGEEDDLSKY